ncbi:hypothetical protein SAMN05443668_102692 [Cryptosporangium aurantiacum]|uniref:Uncharacterized protein n=1 Tax=Cryptosporangium aurantiacum TaxID=134849 RepID=A0A1M7NK94_9ACTN|nr:hypothetical protein SAMN05443668_102692 [Cryptosporangium aurantiacum]
MLTLVFAAELYAATAAPMGLIVLQGATVLGTMVLSAVLVVLGGATLAQPLLRTITGPIVVLLALVSLLVSNFGGFLIGMVLGVVGGGMMFAWSPTKNAALATPDVLLSDEAEPETDVLHVDDAEPATDVLALDDAEPPTADLHVDDAEPLTADLHLNDAEPPTADLHLPAEPIDADSAAAERWRGLPGGTAAESEPPTGPGRHRRLLSVLVWLVPALAVALILTTTGAPAVADTPGGQPRDLPCLIPFLCPEPTPEPEPEPAPSPSPSAPLFPDLLPKPGPSASASPTPGATCAPEDYPTGDGTPVGEAAALAARILQACAKAGTPNAGTADEVSAVGIEPGVLKADRLTLEDLTYRGTVKLATATGSTTVMEFSATKLTIVGMDLRVPFNARTITLAGTGGSATISGNVKLYAADLSGKALDLLPLKFTPNPPPLLPQIALPSLFFTGVTSHVALVSADTIRTAVSINVA